MTEREPTIHVVQGRRVLLQPNDFPLLYVEAAIGTGFIYETEETSGINHLLEHILTDAWKGCGKAGNCSRFWDTKGVVMNATTDQSYMNFYTQGLPEETDDMLRYICSITDHPVFSAKVLENEKKAVKNELTSYGGEPDSELQDVFNKLVYTKGLAFKDDWQLQIRNLSHLTLGSLRRKFREAFNAANVVYCVAGTFDAAHVLRVLESEFQKAAPAHPFPRSELACFTRAHAVRHVRPKGGGGDDNVTVKIGFPSERTPAENVLVPLVCELLHDLLFDAMRTVAHLVYNVEVDEETNRCGGVVYVQYDVLDRGDNVNQTWSILTELLARLHRAPFTAQAVKAAKNRARLEHELRRTFTTDFLEQLLYQESSAAPVLFTRAEKLEARQAAGAQELTELYRKLCPFEHAVCVYQSRREHATIRFTKSPPSSSSGTSGTRASARSRRRTPRRGSSAA